jgi:two-component system phosphate regulon sensor histidine kinase PhoR
MGPRWYAKILAAFILIIAVVVLPTVVYLSSNLKSFLMAQKEEELQRELKLATKMVSNFFDSGSFNTNQVQEMALRVAADIQKRVTVISKEGKVLGDSGLSSEAVDTMDDHSNRREILEARSQGFGRSIRFSTTLQTNTLYGAVPIYSGNRLKGFIRLAIPLSQIEDLISGLRRKVILAGGLTGLLAVLVSFFITWSLNRPLREITGMVQKMADGELKQPFHVLPKTEFQDLTSSLERMSNELREKIDLLDMETGQLTTLLSTMREGVLVTDEKGRIIMMNSFLEQVLGEKEWKKKTVQEVFMNSEFQDAIEAVLTGDSFKTLNIIFGRNPQRDFDVQIVALAPAGKTRRAVALLHDTTALQYLLKVRQDFVANASHELRTPLTSISGYVETLLSLVPDQPPELRRFLSIIQKNVGQMNFLVSDLLDLAKLDLKEEAKDIRGPVSVREILEGAAQMIREPAGKKGITFEENWQYLPRNLTGWWEKDRIIQAVFNLLDNAVKYTPAGGQVVLSAKTASPLEVGVQGKNGIDDPRTTNDERHRDFIEISVEDTGIGIPREHLSRIFERFYRVDKARSRELGGTGLGLAIVKHIVETHGGSVEAESTPNKGSTFKLILPLDPKTVTSETGPTFI